MTYDEKISGEYPGAYRVKGFDGVACRVEGWETEEVHSLFCADCSLHMVERCHGGGYTVDPGDRECEHETTYYSDEPEYERTGQLVVRMIGDDTLYVVSPEDVSPLPREEYCGECGQIGCTHDGLERE